MNCVLIKSFPLLYIFWHDVYNNMQVKFYVLLYVYLFVFNWVYWILCFRMQTKFCRNCPKGHKRLNIMALHRFRVGNYYFLIWGVRFRMSTKRSVAFSDGTYLSFFWVLPGKFSMVLPIIHLPLVYLRTLLSFEAIERTRYNFWEGQKP